LLPPSYRTDEANVPDDEKVVPTDIQNAILKYTEETSLPSILEYMKPNYPRFSGVPIEHTSLENLSFRCGLLIKSFTRKDEYDLYNLRHFIFMRSRVFFKKSGKDWVGSAIRLSRVIRIPEIGDHFKTIVKDCFTPNEHPNPNDPFRNGFLKVGAQRWEVLCSTCKGMSAVLFCLV